ncbi:hypothetical protein NC797_08000 [Aquibacillus sp. 3ASR75-11]|uniref:Lipoprotein n=1 Tax=Terrihalobacillus insolitus TaxID=2950438 RepID=A0A9X4ANE2_9BACI|nr:hypothetical protein [Terrihalobacillus insolitus]MDC3424450.1 hypothetical protein [Terrihalobacillus insolitus]
MRKILALLLGVYFLFVLSACSFPNGGEQIDSSSEKVNKDKSDVSTPDSINQELDENLTIKADITAVDTNNLKTNSISLKKFNEDKIINTFLKDRTIVRKDEIKNVLFPEYKDKYLEFSDGSYLTIQLGSLRFRTPYFKDREYDNVISGSTYFIRPDLKDVFTETNLGTIDKNFAVDQVKAVLNEIKIQQLGTPEVIALDYKTLESQWEDYETKDGSQPLKFEKEDEAYVVIFPVVLDKTNITNKGYYNAGNQMNAVGSRIMGVVNKDGLISLTVQGIYEIEGTLKENITPIPLETALEKVKNKYKNTLITDPIVINKIALEYVPTVSNDQSIEFKLIPAWVFSAKQDITVNDKKGGTFQSSQNFTILINALTGNELRNGGER